MKKKEAGSGGNISIFLHVPLFVVRQLFKILSYLSEVEIRISWVSSVLKLDILLNILNPIFFFPLNLNKEIERFQISEIYPYTL